MRLEVLLAQKTPVMQAEHCIDDRTALNFYNCLVPKIKENRRYRIQKDSVFSIADFKEQAKVRQFEYELEQKELPALLKQN